MYDAWATGVLGCRQAQHLAYMLSRIGLHISGRGFSLTLQSESPARLAGGRRERRARWLSYSKGAAKKRNVPWFLITSGACCVGYDLDVGRQPRFDMLCTTHERNSTFPGGSFTWIRHAPPVSARRRYGGSEEFFSLCLLPRRMSFRTFCKRTSTWVFSSTTAATRLLNMSR